MKHGEQPSIVNWQILTLHPYCKFYEHFLSNIVAFHRCFPYVRFNGYFRGLSRKNMLDASKVQRWLQIDRELVDISAESRSRTRLALVLLSIVLSMHTRTAIDSGFQISLNGLWKRCHQNVYWPKRWIRKSVKINQVSQFWMNFGSLRIWMK